MQRMLFFQSLWAMERRHPDGRERGLAENVDLIAGAGFDGVSAHWHERADVRRLSALLEGHGLQAEGQCFPKTVDDLARVLEVASEFPPHHLDIQPDVRPRRLQDCIPILEGWRRLAEQVDFPVYVETHRDRMTTDLHFTLDLLDCFPDLRLVGDLSHILVGREFAWPIAAENEAMMRRVLEHCWVFHGRVASPEQVQVEISFPQHRMWVDLFLGWWELGFRSWRRRARADDTLAFVCELGPRPYAITDRAGNDTTDRWQEALQMRAEVRQVWERVAREDRVVAGA
jgi:hypothetical protein